METFLSMHSLSQQHSVTIQHSYWKNTGRILHIVYSLWHLETRIMKKTWMHVSHEHPFLVL